MHILVFYCCHNALNLTAVSNPFTIPQFCRSEVLGLCCSVGWVLRVSHKAEIKVQGRLWSFLEAVGMICFPAHFGLLASFSFFQLWD